MRWCVSGVNSKQKKRHRQTIFQLTRNDGLCHMASSAVLVKKRGWDASIHGGNVSSKPGWANCLLSCGICFSPTHFHNQLKGHISTCESHHGSFYNDALCFQSCWVSLWWSSSLKLLFKSSYLYSGTGLNINLCKYQVIKVHKGLRLKNFVQNTARTIFIVRTVLSCVLCCSFLVIVKPVRAVVPKVRLGLQHTDGGVTRCLPKNKWIFKITSNCIFNPSLQRVWLYSLFYSVINYFKITLWLLSCCSFVFPQAL